MIGNGRGEGGKRARYGKLEVLTHRTWMVALKLRKLALIYLKSKTPLVVYRKAQSLAHYFF